MKSAQEANQLNFPLNMGDGAAFDQIFKTYYKPLRYFLCKMVTADDAEDLVEDLFMKLWKRKTAFVSKEHAKAFLYRSAHNLCLDFLKAPKHARSQPLTNEDVEEAENYLHKMIETEVYAEIYRAVEALPEQCSKVISLAFIEGLTNGQIALELGIAEKSVRNYKMRGLKLLREKLPDGAMLLLLLLPMMD